jgi:hypothetical protein
MSPPSDAFVTDETTLQLTLLCRECLQAAEPWLGLSEPSEDSQAASDCAPGDGTALDLATARWSGTAYMCAELQLQASADQLMGLVDILTQSESTLPLFTIARSSIEASARALWLLDPTISRDQRAIRGLAETLYSWGEQQRIPDPEGSAENQDLITQALDAARLLGCELTKAPVPQIKEPQRRPGATAAMETLLAPVSERFGSASQNVLSGATHATVYGIGQHLADRDDKRGVVFRRRSDSVVLAVATVCLSFSFACTNRIERFGADASAWRVRSEKMDQEWRDLFNRLRPSR